MRITVAYLLNFEYCYCVVLIGYMTTGVATASQQFLPCVLRVYFVICVNIIVPLTLYVLVKMAM